VGVGRRLPLLLEFLALPPFFFVISSARVWRMRGISVLLADRRLSGTLIYHR
jgi:hypothetical protein